MSNNDYEIKVGEKSYGNVTFADSSDIFKIQATINSVIRKTKCKAVIVNKDINLSEDNPEAVAIIKNLF